MNASELAKLMLDWEIVQKEQLARETIIKETVLQIGQTQTVGNVRTTYSQGRKTYCYEAAAQARKPEIGMDILEPCSKLVIDWKMVCEKAEVADIPFDQGEPSMTVKLLA
jgi:hypothetical protein